MSFTPLLQLKKFSDIPVSTREEARESRPHPEEPHFHLLAREEGSFPCVFGKEFPAFPSHLKRRRSPQERREELQGHATIPRVPQMSQSTPGKPVFTALPRLSRRGSTHTLVARGTPFGKASWESHRSLDPREGKRDTSATLSLRSRSYVESTCRNWRKSRRFSPPGEMRPISAEASRG